MLKEKDVIIAKDRFMVKNPNFKSRRFIVTETDGVIVKMVNYTDSSQSYHGWYNTEDFFYFDDININKDIQDTLDRYEFQSFQGVTLEGKIIQLDLPVPFEKRI